MMKAEAYRILSKIFVNAKPSSVTRFKKGVINETFNVKIKGKDFVLRIFPRDIWKVKKEEHLYDLISKKTGVPVPKIIIKGRTPTINITVFLVAVSATKNKTMAIKR